MRYIPCDKMTKLREAARNGDEMAKKILHAQLDEEADFSKDLDAFFAPKVEAPVVEEKATDVPVQEGKAEEHAQEQVGDISQKITDLIGECDKKTLEIANNSDLSEATKKGALSILGEIKTSCLDSLEKFGKLMSSISKKENKEEVTQ